MAASCCRSGRARSRLLCLPCDRVCRICRGRALCLLARMLKNDERNGTADTAVTVGGRIFILTLSLAAASLWVSASISGASMGVSKVILQGLGVIILVIAVAIDRLFGWKNIFVQIVAREPLARRLIRFFLTSDYSRAGIVAIASPLLLLLIVLSVCNQLVRINILRTVVLPAERASWVTLKVAGMLRRIYAWNWTSVLRKMIVLSLVYMIWVVGIMKVTTLFFSWLTHTLKPLPLPLTTGVFVAVGMTMFLLPPVPGAPVYMAAGVLLTSMAEDRFGFAGAALYSICVAWCIKLCACALQQKVIGTNLGRSRRVRSLVMINTPLMRALAAHDAAGRPQPWQGGDARGRSRLAHSVMMGILGMRLVPGRRHDADHLLDRAASLSGSFMIMGPTSPYPALTNIALAPRRSPSSAPSSRCSTTSSASHRPSATSRDAALRRGGPSSRPRREGVRRALRRAHGVE